MKKLKLDLNQIQVFSFRVETPRSSSGTVNAFSASIGCGTWDCSNELNSCGSCDPHDCPYDPITWGC